MRLAVCSDLHLDVYPNFSKAFVDSFDGAGIDALVIAGDLSDGTQKKGVNGERTRAVKTFCERYPLVFMVMGNHDHYGSSFEEVAGRNKQWMNMFPNLIILDTGQNYIHKDSGLKIAGAPMWYPDNALVQYNKSYWPDFKYIHNRAESKIFKANSDFRDSLNSLQPQNYPDIVITHMLPSPLVINAEFKDAETNCYFLSDETKLIEKIQPKLWVFGHTHYPFDIKIGSTRLFSNPRGYVNEGANPDFSNRMLVEV